MNYLRERERGEIISILKHLALTKTYIYIKTLKRKMRNNRSSEYWFWKFEIVLYWSPVHSIRLYFIYLLRLLMLIRIIEWRIEKRLMCKFRNKNKRKKNKLVNWSMTSTKTNRFKNSTVVDCSSIQLWNKLSSEQLNRELNCVGLLSCINPDRCLFMSFLLCFWMINDVELRLLLFFLKWIFDYNN